MSNTCCSCGKGRLLGYFITCKSCEEKKKQELIGEFLKDWRWGRVYKIHWSTRGFWKICRCKNNPSTYWEWFEKKWEELRKKQ